MDHYPILNQVTNEGICIYIYIFYPNSIQFRKMITNIFHVQATNEDMQIFIIYKSLHSH